MILIWPYFGDRCYNIIIGSPKIHWAFFILKCKDLFLPAVTNKNKESCIDVFYWTEYKSQTKRKGMQIRKSDKYLAIVIRIYILPLWSENISCHYYQNIYLTSMIRKYILPLFLEYISYQYDQKIYLAIVIKIYILTVWSENISCHCYQNKYFSILIRIYISPWKSEYILPSSV